MSIIVFDHYYPATGEELWLNSGGITKLVADINPGPGWSSPESLTSAGGTLFFTAYNGTGNSYQLFKTDGTAAGTVMLNSGAYNGPINNLFSVNGTLFFEAAATNILHGAQLWASDGTVAETVKLTDAPNGFIANPVTAFYGNYFFQVLQGQNSQLWKSDGTPGGTVAVTNESGGLAVESYVPPTNSPHVQSDSPVVIGNDFYFVALDNNGYQIWKSDGTPSGTTMVTDVNGNTNPYGMYAAWPTNVNGTLFFSANDGNGPEIWKSDGTPGGTVMVANLIPGTGTTYVNPYDLTAVQ